MKIVLPTLHVRPSAQAVPLAAGCLAAALPASMLAAARLIDLFPATPPEAMLSEILATDPQLVAFSLYVWNRTAVLDLARQLRQRRPGLRLVAGGPEASADPAGVLAGGNFDAVICGEGEETFRELVQALQGGESLAGVAGLQLPSPQGPVATAARGGPDLANLPSPWLGGALRAQTEGGVLWETSRGCTFACDFCFDSRGRQGVRPVPSARLAEELELFVKARVAQVWVLDSTFNYPPERGKALLRLIARKAPHLHFHLEAKADFLDAETARLLARLPCSVQIGLQSARPEVLRNIHRSFEAKSFAGKIHLLAAEGVTYGLDLIYGLPGDNHQGFRHSLNYALDLQPNQVDIFPLALLPGTALYEKRDTFGLRAQSQPPYEIEASASYSAADLQASRQLAAAVNLFYNVGRAVAFFPALLRAGAGDAAAFFEEFADWALTRKKVDPARFFSSEGWQPKEILHLQEGFARHFLTERGRQDLLSAALDLIRYHFHYAETLLGPETLPTPPETLRDLVLWETPWRRASSLRLVPFSYEILDLLEMGEADLEQIVALFRPVGSLAVFLRRGGEVFCESLEEEFSKLLQGSDGLKSPAAIFGGSIGRAEGEEIVEFALAEGFLVPSGGQ